MGDEIRGTPREYAPESYAMSGKIMLSAIVILFTVILLVLCLHLYARWFLLRARRRNHNLRRRSRRTHLVFATEPVVISPGLEASVIKSLPTFIYSTNTFDEVLECAVCLSEFEENEKGRRLPKCNHSFHIDCIDMWLLSHSTCPLCRSPVNPEIPEPATENSVEIVIDSGESEPGTSSELCSSCRHGEDEMGCASSSNSAPPVSSVGSRRKGLELVGISIEVPRRNESFKGLEEELQGFKSPGGRILALKRILSRERKPSLPSTPSTPYYLNFNSSATEIELENGREEGAQETDAPSLDRTRTTSVSVS